MRFSLTLLSCVALMASETYASVTCLKVGATATARWTDSAGRSCSWSGVVGSNFGTSGSGEYSCNGRCGAGCTGVSLGNVYTQDCWSHDICSWFEGASGGASDKNCGAAYKAAIDDTATGLFYGCSQTNPHSAVAVPASEPVCI